MDNLAAPVQAVYPLSAARSRDLEAIARHIGADPRSLHYFRPKRRVRHLYAPRVDYRAAAFVKQELLARGGDAVVARQDERKRLRGAMNSRTTILSEGAPGSGRKTLLGQ